MATTRRWPGEPGRPATSADLERAAAERVDRPSRGGQLGRRGRRASRRPARRPARAAGRRARRARPGAATARAVTDRPAPAVPAVGGQRLGPGRRRPRPVAPSPVAADDGSQEARPSWRSARRAAHRARRERRGERQARDSRRPSPRSSEPVDAALAQPRATRGQAVEDVRGRDRGRLADRGEVDRRGPGEQQADVPVDRGPGRRRRASSAEVVEARRRGRASYAGGRSGVSSTRVGSGSRSAVHGTPPVVRVPPSARRRSRRRLVSHRGRWFGLPRSVRFAAGFPRAPRGPRYPRVRPSAGCGRYGSGAGPVNRVYPRTAPSAVNSWISRSRREPAVSGRAIGASGRARTSGAVGRSSSRLPIGSCRGAPSCAVRGVAACPRPSRRAGAGRRSGAGPSRRRARPATAAAMAAAGHRAGRPGQDEDEARPDPRQAGRRRASPPIARARSRAIGSPRPVPVTRSWPAIR